MTSLPGPLRQRLEFLRGPAAAQTVEGHRALAHALRAAPAFAAALARAKALADGNRLLILGLLKRCEVLCACEIQAALGLSHATVSHHMDVLFAAGLVTAERHGKWMHYALTANARGRAP